MERIPTVLDNISPMGRIVLLVAIIILLGAVVAIGQEEAIKKTSSDLIEARAEVLRAEERYKKVLEDAKRRADPAMRKALEETEKVRKAEEEQVKLIKRADLQGCDSESIWIHPNAAPPRWTINSSVRVRVYNPSKVPVDIESPRHGLVVRNLCSGGSLTLYWSRNVGNADYMQLNFTAKGRLPDGTMLLGESQWYSLSKYDWSSGRGEQYYTWEIRLSAR